MINSSNGNFLYTFSLDINSALRLNIFIEDDEFGFLNPHSELPYTEFSMHMHTHFEAFFVTKGAMVLKTPHKEVVFNENDFCCVSPGELHTTYFNEERGGNQCQRVSILFDFQPITVSNVKDKKSHPSFVVESPIVVIRNNKKIKRIVEYLLQRVEDFSYPYSEYEKSIISFIVSDLIFSTLLVSSQPLLAEKNVARIGSIEMQKFMINQYVSMHYADDISLEHLSKMFFMGKGKIIEIIKEITGMTFRQYVIYLRMMHAENLVVNTNYEIAKIAMMVGYNSENGFFKAFAKMYGDTPDGYRKRIHKKNFEQNV